MEIVSAEEALALQGSICQLLEWGRENYEFAGVPGNDAKDVQRELECESLGERVDGCLGRRDLPKDYLFKLVDLTLYMLSIVQPSRKLAQILGGRWVRAMMLRRATREASKEGTSKIGEVKLGQRGGFALFTG